MAEKLISNRFAIHDPERDLLGRGGMGEVYRATDTQTEETVAVKALNPEVLECDPSLLERFLREGQALRQLNHPNIVRMVAAVEENGRHYLVMEYVGGGSLQDLLTSRGCLPANEVVKIALEVADALTRAHHLGIIHRDLKPDNVLLAEDGTPRLADFGIAHIQDRSHLTQSGMVIGTVDYLSPEACNGEQLDERADIWSFGVMLFQMFTGKLPFTGESLTSKLIAILTQPVPDLTQFASGVPDALTDLVYRMLEKDPQQRIPSVRLVGAELEALLKGRQPVTPSQPVSMESRFETPTPSTQKVKHNLPIQPTLFVGRQAELTELARLFHDPGVRLVTILGAGGMGKTRLALESGLAQLENYPHGVYFIPLAPLISSDAIIPAIAQALGFSFREGGQPRQQLLDYLAEKTMLLILDNFEHILSGAELVSGILNASPHMKILATSRARLNVQGEQLFHLGGMDFPDWQTPDDVKEYTAVKLFLQSARRVRPNFTLTLDQLKSVARICKLVEGNPLGILLAAAWVEMLTPEEIAKEIEKNLDFLETGQRDVPDRQRSMRGVFDYSWNLLTPGEQAVFRELSIFRAGFTREAAQQVTGASLRELMELVNKSILQRTPTGRFEIHELLRQYGAEKLAEFPEQEQDARERHCAYFAEFTSSRDAQLHGNDQRSVLVGIETEFENIKVGWGWAVDHLQVGRIAAYLESIGELHSMRGWSKEGASLFSHASRSLSIPQEKVTDRAAQLLYGQLLLWQGRLTDAFDTAESMNQLLMASLAIFRELGARKEMAYALCYLGGCESLYGNTNGEPFCQEALGIFQEISHPGGIALARRGLAWATLHHGNYPLAKQRFQESLALFRELGDQKEIARSLGGLGYTNWILGEYQLSRQQHEEMLVLCRQIDNQGGIARSLGNLGIATYGLGDYQKAREFWLSSLALYREIGDPWGMADEFGDLGAGALATRDYQQAAEFARQSLDLHAKVSRRMDTFTLMVMGKAMLGLDNLPLAKSYLRQSLQSAFMVHGWGHILLTSIGVATFLLKDGKDERALELLYLVMSHPASWQMAKDQAMPLITELEARLPPDVTASALARGRLRDLEATVAELVAGLGE